MTDQLVKIDVRPHSGQMERRTFIIHGDYARKLMGGTNEITLVSSNMQMAMNGMIGRFGPKFRKFITEGQFHLYHNVDEGDGVAMADAQNLDGAKVVHIVPHVEGAGRAGQIIMGVVLIVVGILTIAWSGGAGTPAGKLAIMNGAMMILGGALTIYSALTTPRNTARKDVAENESFVFDNAANVIEQGGAVPLVFGVYLAGTTVVTAGISTEKLSTYTSPFPTSSAPDSLWGLELNPVV